MTPKILIVDDDADARMMLRELLGGYECEVLEAADGAEGLARMNDHRPDLVLLDLAMPGMDGAQMLAKAHADPTLKPIPVMMLTGHANRPTVIRIARLGVRDYIIKPFTPELLRERIGTVIELKPKGSADRPAKRFDEPLSILLVDNQTAIHELVKQGLADTAWQVRTETAVPAALAACHSSPPDLALVSLALPADGAATFFAGLRAETATRKVPVFGLSVKTALEEQRHALGQGFAAVVTKPIQFDRLKAQICRGLNLDVSGRYFEQRQGVLILRLPAVISSDCGEEVLGLLPARAAAAVEAGVDKLVLDLSQIKQPGPGLVTLIMHVVQRCDELALNYRIVGSEAVCAECRKASKGWSFAASVDEAISLLNMTEPVTT